MRNAVGWLLVAVLASCAATHSAAPGPERFELFVLGRAQDGGVPHVGCERECCAEARARGRVEHPACLGVHDRQTGALLLVEATPAVEAQIALLHELSGVRGRGRRPVDAVLVTHAHIGHYLGLVHFGREVAATADLPVFCSERMAGFLAANGPWSQLVALDQIELVRVTPGVGFEPLPGLRVEAIAVPHRDEFSDTLAFKLRGPERCVLFVPDVDRWQGHEALLERLLDGVDVAYLDATFWDGSELPDRDLASIRHPLMVDTMERLAASARERPGRLRFIHLNHSNPALRDAAIVGEIEARGFRVARVGERVAM